MTKRSTSRRPAAASSRRRPTPPEPGIYLVAGQTRSGKTYTVAQAVAGAERLLVWDSMLEFGSTYRCRPVTDPRALYEIALSPTPGRWAYQRPIDRVEFDAFCRFAWVWLRANAAAGHRCALVVEELADVTPPGKAPPAWGEIVRKSMRFEPSIYALTQRPAESDKTVLGNVSVLRCHAMARREDRRMMASELDVDVALVDGLDLERKQWIARSRVTRELTRGGKGENTRRAA